MTQHSGLLREAPPAWDGLLARTEKIIDGAQVHNDITTDMASEILRGVHDLDNEIVDANRFHGIALIACEFAQIISNPIMKEYAVKAAATDMVTAAYTPKSNKVKGKGLRINDLDSVQILPTFISLSHAAYDRTPLATRLTADALGVIIHERRLSRFRNDTSAAMQTLNYKKLYPHSDTKALLTERMTVKSVAQDSVSGAVIITKLALENFWRMNRSKMTKVENSTNPYIATVRELGFVFSPSFKSVATKASILRLDEFQTRKRDFFRVDKNGELTFDTNLLRSEYLPPHNSVEAPSPVMHTERLHCPALRVPGLVGAMVIDTIPSILDEADSQMMEAHKQLPRRAKRYPWQRKQA